MISDINVHNMLIYIFSVQKHLIKLLLFKNLKINKLIIVFKESLSYSKLL